MTSSLKEADQPLVKPQKNKIGRVQSSEPANPDKPELKPQENEAEKLSEPAQ